MIKQFISSKKDNSKSLIFTFIYTTGHFFIAVICAMFILGADFNMASIDAFVEPLINAIWLYVLHRFFFNL
tara:strand:- start:111 stop:323 length:213 start_codon:yes stop_codon:yes gene_type:complete